MIFADRSLVQPPPELLAKAAGGANGLLRSKPRGRSERIMFDDALIHEFDPFVQRLFRMKCAFCETTHLSAALSLHHFRPEIDARALDGKTDPFHYFWLAYDWQNLYLICAECAGAKRTAFPVVSERAAIGADPSAERPLLLDPCRDQPGWYLEFRDDGLVVPRPLTTGDLQPYGNIHPGEVTIRAFALNRLYLIEARRNAADLFKSLLAKLVRSLGADPDGVRSLLIAAMEPAGAYSAVQREILRSLPGPLGALRDLVQELFPDIIALVRAPGAARSARARTKSGDFATRALKVRKVEIEGFRAVRALSLDFETGPRKWMILLGENATGKTTILQAMSLALMGEPFARKRFDERPFLSRYGRKSPSKGRIRVHLDMESEPIEIIFTRDEMKFTSGRDGAKTFLRAYGAMRLAADTDSKRISRKAMDAESLWDARRPVPSARHWIARLTGEQLRPIKIALRDLLLVDEQTPITRKRGALQLSLHGTPFTSDELSSGYVDVLNVVTDIMSSFPGGVGDMQSAYGIVMIDELGAHLHPRWKMQIVAALKKTFQGMQFICTTHDPLCLRTIDSNEVAVLVREESGVYAMTGLPAPDRMRVDQLLTSRLFGLQSTIDPRLDARFDDYYNLLRLTEPTEDDKAEIERLRRELSSVSVLGSSRREQLVYEIVDGYLANETEHQGARAAAIVSAELREAVRREWARLNESPEDIP